MGKKTLPLIFMILLSIILTRMPLVSANGDQVKIEVVFENGLNEIVKTQCDNFNVTVRISLPPGNQTDFVALEIHWNTTVLELQTGTTADVIEGPWMKTFGSTAFQVASVDNTAGILNDIACGYMTASKANGSGVFCYIKFHCKAPGAGTIEIYKPTNEDDAETYILDGANLVAIDVAVNGTVVPEFSAFMLLSLFLIATTTAIIAANIWSRKRRIPIQIP